MEIKDYKYGDPFKFRYLKTYSSEDDLAGNKKKYRKVFDIKELTFLRWEVNFYNKLFDEEDWRTKIELKVLKIIHGRKEEICHLKKDLEVERHKNEVQFYFSWGNSTVGSFWQEGEYVVQAYIDSKQIGESNFFIQDYGLVNNEINPYFELVSMKLFSGDSSAVKDPDRKQTYLKKFNSTKTKFIWFEVTIKNKLKGAWRCETFLNVYDNAGNLKTKLDRLIYIDKDSKGVKYTYFKGWGNDAPGSWAKNKYRLDLVFMDTLIASLTFEVGDEDVTGNNSLKITGEDILQDHNEEEELSLEELMQKINELVGLKKIKSQIQEHISYIEFLKLRKERGFKDDEKITLHSIFTGNPGTGKTTVVKLLGKIYNKMNLLSSGHIHEVDRADLVGEFIGQTAPKVRKAIDEARGGILFIDEAYSLARSDNDKKDYGREVIEILIKEMSDGQGDLAIMVAGYPKEMQTFIEINPGLKSRFAYEFHFEDYTPDELMAIAELAARKRDVTMENEAKNQIYKILLDAYRNRDEFFGNARFAYSLIDEAKVNLGLRLVKLPNIRTLPSRKFSLITLEDIKNIKSLKEENNISIPIDEELLKLSLNELNELVGMENIKNEINDTIKLVRYYKETGKDALNQVAKHTVFKGNPGTGKTTVARIISKIYKALGLLERGHLVETSREDLVAGYVGQTALKTKDRINEALGGVLFIDEVYSLSDNDKNGFGKEAVEVILKTMEDRRGDFVLIVAGYPNLVDNFLTSNPGLKSRFDATFHFYDYKADVLQRIAVSMLKKQSLTPDTDAANFLRKSLHNQYENKDMYFGNARFVRRVVEKVIKNQHLRMAFIPYRQRTAEMMSHVTIEDFKNIPDLKKKEKKKMGF